MYDALEPNDGKEPGREAGNPCQQQHGEDDKAAEGRLGVEPRGYGLALGPGLHHFATVAGGEKDTPHALMTRTQKRQSKLWCRITTSVVVSMSSVKRMSDSYANFVLTIKYGQLGAPKGPVISDWGFEICKLF